MNITTFIGSSREESNSELLSDLVTKDIKHHKIDLKNLSIQPIHDLRHAEGGFQLVDDDYDKIISAFLESDLIIFSTPIYWYSMSGIMKTMIDRLSHAIRDERFPQFKEHLKSVNAIVIAVGGDEPKIKGLPLIQQFQYTFDFLNMRFSSYIIGEGNKPGDILQDQQAVSQANLLNKQLKNLK
ncbi:flavodoxin family protein [Viridibacillus sp. YIM B01967]|uniref:Flavodoxin family protein n=1 Tax=Viridibacillus soli TaxID=2798301 RepID=A0ABS1H471_9BACL|nr:flavodoxin family protein [Viridibacillus soli]MBK3494212.1 flavodoxin family protein [Viridibacillus soli]